MPPVSIKIDPGLRHLDRLTITNNGHGTVIDACLDDLETSLATQFGGGGDRHRHSHVDITCWPVLKPVSHRTADNACRSAGRGDDGEYAPRQRRDWKSRRHQVSRPLLTMW